MALYRFDPDGARNPMPRLSWLREGIIRSWIAPVEPCEHGNYATHIIPGTAMLGERFGESFVAAHQWCPGSPDPETTDSQGADEEER